MLYIGILVHLRRCRISSSYLSFISMSLSNHLIYFICSYRHLHHSSSCHQQHHFNRLSSTASFIILSSTASFIILSSTAVFNVKKYHSSSYHSSSYNRVFIFIGIGGKGEQALLTNVNIIFRAKCKV